MLNKPIKHDDIDSLINNTLNEDIQGGIRSVFSN